MLKFGAVRSNQSESSTPGLPTNGGLVLKYFLSETIHNSSRGTHFVKFLISNFLKGLTYSAMDGFRRNLGTLGVLDATSPRWPLQRFFFKTTNMSRKVPLHPIIISPLVIIFVAILATSLFDCFVKN